MDKGRRFEIGLWLDLYGELLTRHQNEVGQLYWQEDWSLAEISQRLGITRSAVHDLLDRTFKLLCHYEERLHLLESCRRRQHLLHELGAALAEAPNGEWKRRAENAYGRLAAEEGMTDV